MDKQQLLAHLRESLLETDPDEATLAAQAVMDGGVDAMEAIQVASPRAIAEVGDLFESGDLYLPSLMLAGEAMKRSISILSRYLAQRSRPARKRARS